MRSMTGFGHASGEVFGRRCIVEVRSVNHRYLDIKLRPGPGWVDPMLEVLLGQAVRRRIERGSLIITIRDDGNHAHEPTVHVDRPMVRAYRVALGELLDLLGGKECSTSPHALSEQELAPLLPVLLTQPGLLTIGDGPCDPEERFRAVAPILDGALVELLQARKREGKALAEDLLKRLGILSDFLDEVAHLTERAPEQQKRKLEERLHRLLDSGAPVDPQRLAHEVAILADRLDVTEEITRLRAHFIEFARLCQGEPSSGRRLDFLVQEINREINTISSKSQSAEVAARVVAMKAEVERLREQIQNVE